jgi:hypothetical protein
MQVRGLLRARSRFPEIVGIIRKQEHRKESLEPGLVLAKQVVVRQYFIRAKMVDSVVSPFPLTTFHVSTS